VPNLIPLSMILNTAPPLPQPAHRLGPAIESNDPGARPLPNGAAWWANRWSSRLPHRLFRSGGVQETKGPTSLEGSAGGGPAVAREGVGEVGSVVVVCGASGPWSRPCGLMDMCAIRCITDAPMEPMTTEIRCLSSSSSPPSSSPHRLDDDGSWIGATRLGQSQPWMAHVPP
jgi:hypothetical protein